MGINGLERKKEIKKEVLELVTLFLLFYSSFFLLVLFLLLLTETKTSAGSITGKKPTHD
jgi:hypothetical protein